MTVFKNVINILLNGTAHIFILILEGKSGDPTFFNSFLTGEPTESNGTKTLDLWDLTVQPIPRLHHFWLS